MGRLQLEIDRWKELNVLLTRYLLGAKHVCSEHNCNWLARSQRRCCCSAIGAPFATWVARAAI